MGNLCSWTEDDRLNEAVSIPINISQPPVNGPQNVNSANYIQIIVQEELKEQTDMHQPLSLEEEFAKMISSFSLKDRVVSVLNILN